MTVLVSYSYYLYQNKKRTYVSVSCYVLCGTCYITTVLVEKVQLARSEFPAQRQLQQLVRLVLRLVRLHPSFYPWKLSLLVA